MMMTTIMINGFFLKKKSFSGFSNKNNNITPEILQINVQNL